MHAPFLQCDKMLKIICTFHFRIILHYGVFSYFLIGILFASPLLKQFLFSSPPTLFSRFNNVVEISVHIWASLDNNLHIRDITLSSITSEQSVRTMTISPFGLHHQWIRLFSLSYLCPLPVLDALILRIRYFQNEQWRIKHHLKARPWKMTMKPMMTLGKHKNYETIDPKSEMNRSNMGGCWKKAPA